MIHLLDKLSAGQLGVLLLIIIVGGYITICTVARYITAAITGRYEDETAEPQAASGEGEENDHGVHTASPADD